MGVTFTSDWWRGCDEFSIPIAERRKEKDNSSKLLSTHDTEFLWRSIWVVKKSVIQLVDMSAAVVTVLLAWSGYCSIQGLSKAVFKWHCRFCSMFRDDCMFVWLGKQQLLAVGDGMGTLHVMEVPWNLRHPSANEVNCFPFSSSNLFWGVCIQVTWGWN